METPGGYLKREREMRGIALEDVARAIKLSVKLVEALESNEYDKLPHPVYIKGFIRAYARYLGLDENDAVLRFEVYIRDLEGEKTSPLAAEKEYSHKKAEPSRKPYMIAALSALLGIIVIAIYLMLSSGSSQQKVEKPAERLSSVEPKGSTVAKPPPSEKKAASKPTTATDVAKSSEKEKVSEPVAKPTGEVAELTTTPADTESTPKTPVTKPVTPYTLDVYAKGTTWIKAQIDEEEPFEVLLREGEHIKWKADKVFF